MSKFWLRLVKFLWRFEGFKDALEDYLDDRLKRRYKSEASR